METQRIEGFRLSPQQRRLWKSRPEPAAAVAQVAFRLAGEVDRAVLRRALESLVARHEILRTSYRRLSGMDLPIQVPGEPRLAFRELSRDGGEEDLRRLLEEEAVPFDLEDGSIARFAYLPLDGREHLLVVTLPAAAADDRSFGNVLAELAEAYGLASAGAPQSPHGETDGAVQYVDISEWQNEMLEEPESAARRDFWRRQGSMRGDGSWTVRWPVMEDGARGRRSARLGLGPELSARLDLWAAEHGIPVATVLLTGWRLLLGRLVDQPALNLGFRADGRRFEQLEGALGLLARYLPLAVEVRPGLQAAEVMAAVHAAVEEALQNQECFLWDDYAGDGAEAAGSFPALFDFAETPAPREEGGVRFVLVDCRTDFEPCDLRLSARRGAEGLCLDLASRPGLLSAVEAARWLARYEALLRSLLDDSSRPVAELGCMGEEELQKIVGWSRREPREIAGEPLHRLFERQAERSPEALAVVADVESLTYAALDERANRLARLLVRRGLSPGGLLGIAMDRSADQIAALLAAWKAGAAFVPLDPAQPRQRLARMIDDLSAAGAGLVLLTRSAHSGLLAAAGAPVVVLDLEAGALARERAVGLGREIDPEAPAYWLFTSGSTGRPKAAVIRHRSVVNLAAALDREVYAPYRDGEPLRVGVNAPLVFDASIKQIVQLLAGHILHLIPEEVRRDSEALLAFVRRQALDVFDCTPSQLRLLLAAGLLTGPAPRLMLIGGDAIDRELWSLLAASQQAVFYNVYGPTECTVDATAERIVQGVAPSIGRPLRNVEVHLLDGLGGGLQQVPVGIAGELCIGGAGLALGYAGRPALTAERFVPHPFARTPGERLYRSGDRARFLPGGRIGFLGRADHQIKVRGFRVELGEIEAAFAEHSGVREAVVIALDGQAGSPRLVAYVVPKTSAAARRAEGARHVLPDGLSVFALDRTETDYMFHEIFRERSYLRHGIALPEDGVVFDVGANIGLFALFVAREAPRAQVFAFEPIPAVVEALRSNAALHFPHAQIFPFGLAARDETASFTFYPHFSARSGLAAFADRENDLAVTRLHLRNTWSADEADRFAGEMDDLLAGKFIAEIVEAPVRRLSDVIREEGVARIDLLKIDVQRAELEVLHGMDEEAWCRVEQVVMEVHDEPGGPTEGRLAEVTALLAAQGFDVFSEQDEALRGTDRYSLFASRRGLSIGCAAAADAPAVSAAVPGGASFVLPNGMVVEQHNRNETEFLYQQIFRDRVYLQNGVVLEEGDVVFDVGANIGLFSLFVLQESPQARVYAFEPIPSSFTRLRHNLAAYGSRAELFQCGLADRRGSSRFTFYPLWSASSGAYADEAADLEAARRFLLNRDRALEDFADEILAGRFRGETVEAELRTLSDVVRELGIDRIGLLKLDVEKSEWDILRGIEEQDWPKIRQIVAEVHDLDGRLAAVHRLLEDRGFQIVETQDRLAAGTGIYNLYAVRRGAASVNHPARTQPATVAPPVPAGELTAVRLREFLVERLPEAMMPAEIIFLQELPYNRSGKVDRSALPSPEEVRQTRERELLAPRTPVEEVLVSIYSEILGIDRLGVDESFFERGGHSLLATQAVSRIRAAFQIEFPLRALFESPTVAALAPRVTGLLEAGLGVAAPPLEPAPEGIEPPLSFLQESLWFLQQLHPESVSYNSSWVLHLAGRLDPDVLDAVLTELVRRHAILRTSFPCPEGRPVQRVAPPSPERLARRDLRGLSASKEAAARGLAESEIRRPFDLTAGPPFRGLLLRLGEEEHVIVLVVHHIACDGWSLTLLQGEVTALYSAYAEGRPSPLPEPELQYADFAYWQRRWMQGSVVDEHLAYWKGRLAGAPPAIELPQDGDSTAETRRRAFLLPAELAAGLHRLGRSQSATLYMTLLAAFSVLLARSTGEEDLVIGTAIAGRDRVETEGIVGLFINMLPIRLDLSGASGFLALLEQVRRRTIEAYMHQGLPFEKIVAELPQVRPAGRNPVYQVAFGLQNLPWGSLELSGLRLSSWEIDNGEVRLDLTLWMAESPEGLRAFWAYNPALFRSTTIERWQARFERLLGAILARPNASLFEIEALSEEEQQELENRKRRRESANLSRLRSLRRRSAGA
jgi:amino acid adenylation domain-containing protein/FkbM family methyltransferase